jgi:hypothetical protein
MTQTPPEAIGSIVPMLTPLRIDPKPWAAAYISEIYRRLSSLLATETPIS